MNLTLLPVGERFVIVVVMVGFVDDWVAIWRLVGVVVISIHLLNSQEARKER